MGSEAEAHKCQDLLDLPRSDKRYNGRGPRGSGGLCQGQDHQRQGTQGISDQGLQAPVC